MRMNRQIIIVQKQDIQHTIRNVRNLWYLPANLQWRVETHNIRTNTGHSRNAERGESEQFYLHYIIRIGLHQTGSCASCL